MEWDLADDFYAALIANGGRVVMWEADLIRAALGGSPGDVAARCDSPVGHLFRRHFASRLTADQTIIATRTGDSPN